MCGVADSNYFKKFSAQADRALEINIKKSIFLTYLVTTIFNVVYLSALLRNSFAMRGGAKRFETYRNTTPR